MTAHTWHRAAGSPVFARDHLLEGQVQSLSRAGLLTVMLSCLIRQARAAHSDFAAKCRPSFGNGHLCKMLDTMRQSHAHSTRHDPLTGLPGHAAFSGALEATIHHVAETMGPVSLLLPDLDHFKSLNDNPAPGAAADQVEPD